MPGSLGHVAYRSNARIKAFGFYRNKVSPDGSRLDQFVRFSIQTDGAEFTAYDTHARSVLSLCRHPIRDTFGLVTHVCRAMRVKCIQFQTPFQMLSALLNNQNKNREICS